MTLRNSSAAQATPVVAAPFVLGFHQIRKEDTARAGGKGGNLGELCAAGLPVPPGFVVTAGAYLSAVEQAGNRAVLLEAVAALPEDDPAALETTSGALRERVVGAGMPAEVRTAVLDAYHALGADTRVAVRSSATMEDGAQAS